MLSPSWAQLWSVKIKVYGENILDKTKVQVLMLKLITKITFSWEVGFCFKVV